MYPTKLNSSINPSGWAPSIDYKQSLQEIRNQLTPAQIYRAKARAFNREQKTLNHLESVIQSNYIKCSNAALKIQKCFRNAKKRWRLKDIKESLELTRNQTVAKSVCAQKLSENDVIGAIDALDEMIAPSDDVLIAKAKMVYSVGDFIRTEDIARKLIGWNYSSNILLKISRVNVSSNRIFEYQRRRTFHLRFVIS